MTKNRGVELAQAALRATVQTVRGVLTVPHYLGCWTENRLLVLIPHCSEELAEHLPVKLRSLAQTCGLMWWGDRVNVDVSVGSAYVAEKGSLEELIARLEQRLRDSDDNPRESCGCSS